MIPLIVHFKQILNTIYNLTISSHNWEGSDIWRFFKNDVKDYCIINNPDYLNVLIVLTDGYIYHVQSKERVKNRTAYITGNYLQQEGFRNNPNWKQKFEQKDYGLIVKTKNLNNLNVLFLEINPSANYKDDEDIIRAFLSKWLDEMGIKRYKIYNTDLPSNTSQRIIDFFKQ